MLKLRYRLTVEFVRRQWVNEGVRLSDVQVVEVDARALSPRVRYALWVTNALEEGWLVVSRVEDGQVRVVQDKPLPVRKVVLVPWVMEYLVENPYKLVDMWYEGWLRRVQGLDRMLVECEELWGTPEAFGLEVRDRRVFDMVSAERVSYLRTLGALLDDTAGVA